MRTVLRGLAYFGAAIAALILILIAYIFYDVSSGVNATDFTNTTIEADGATLNAYLAQPEGEGPFPAVLMIHEWWGIRQEIVEKADALAAEGYVVLAVDAYRGTVATGVPGAIWNTINYPQESIDADMRAFHGYLAGLEGVDAEQIGVMGFCFGGRQSVLFAVNNPGDVSAVLTYYGGGQPNTVEALTPLAGEDVRVLGVFGAEDASIPLDQVEAFEASLEELGVAHEVTVYDGVGHAFVTELEGEGPSPEAWAQGVAFLDNVTPLR